MATTGKGALTGTSSLQIPAMFSLARLSSLLSMRQPIMPFRKADSVPKFAQDLIDNFQKDIDLHGAEEGKSVCVLNFLRSSGDKSKRKGNSEYEARMMAMFAETNAGPLHIGPVPEQSDDDAETIFTRMAMVRYPSKRFFQRLLGSRFMVGSGEGEGAAKGKSLGDTLAVATVPVLSRL